MLDFITRNFLAISSALIAISSGISMLVLSSYLAVFDWNLVWLVEYSDITKLLLIGAALVSSILTSIIYTTQDIHTYVFNAATKSKVFAWTLIIVIVGGSIVAAYLDYRDGAKHIQWHLYRTMSVILLLLLVYVAFRDFPHLRSLKWKVMTTYIAFLTLTLGIFGATYGYYVRDVSDANREIQTKDQKFSSAKIIIMFSHHVAFLSDQKVIVMPTSDITRITSELSKY